MATISARELLKLRRRVSELERKIEEKDKKQMIPELELPITVFKTVNSRIRNGYMTGRVEVELRTLANIVGERVKIVIENPLTDKELKQK